MYLLYDNPIVVTRLKLLIVLALVNLNVWSQSSGLRPVDICPLTFVIQGGDRAPEDRCKSDLFRDYELIEGKTARLLTSSRISQVEFSGESIAYQCNCNYGILPEEREVIHCDNGREEASTINFFNNLVVYQWIEPPINSDKNCNTFRSLFRREEPFLAQSNFDIFLPFLDFTFRGRGSLEKALIMGSPWRDSEYFPDNYILDNSIDAFNKLAQVAVEYATCQPELFYSAFPFDLNPGTNASFSSVEEIKQISSPVQLSGLLDPVNGTTADGVSEILVAITATQESQIDSLVLKPEHGSFSFPWGMKSFDFFGNHFYVATYVPPLVFPEEGLPFQSSPQGVVYVDAPFTLYAENADSSKVDKDLTISVVRPPVVLVHGTFDNPKDCWKTGFSDGAVLMETEILIAE